MEGRGALSPFGLLVLANARHHGGDTECTVVYFYITRFSAASCTCNFAMMLHNHPTPTTSSRGSLAMSCQCLMTRSYPLEFCGPLHCRELRGGCEVDCDVKGVPDRRHASTPMPACTPSTMPPEPGPLPPASSFTRWTPPKTRPTQLQCKKKIKIL